MIDRELAKRIVDYLNELHALDPQAIDSLATTRVPCRETLVHHPTCRTAAHYDGHCVGMLSVLNGLCGVNRDGSSAIGVIGRVDAPRVVVGFTLLGENGEILK